MVRPNRILYVIQHTDSEYLGRMEDHFEGRGIRFTYIRPHTTDGKLPPSARFVDGVIFLGGGPWGQLASETCPHYLMKSHCHMNASRSVSHKLVLG